MKQILSTLLSLFIALIPGLTSAQTGTAAPAKTEATESSMLLPEKGLLWEITGNGLDQPSYLFGTIHMIDKENYFLPPGTEEAFGASQRVTFEINIEDMMDLSTQFSLMMGAFMKGNTTLKDLLNEEDYAFVASKFEKLGLPMFLLERIKPMFLSILATDDLSGGGMMSGDIVSYEMELMNMAQESEKELGGLETIEFQLSIFDSISYEAQAKMLVETLKSEDTGEGQFEQMVKMYKDQDIQSMVSSLGDDASGIGDYEHLLLTKRNQSWIPVMREMMADKPTFFAVGAGHLGGETGVINLLVQEGFNLKVLSLNK